MKWSSQVGDKSIILKMLYIKMHLVIIYYYHYHHILNCCLYN